MSTTDLTQRSSIDAGVDAAGRSRCRAATSQLDPTNSTDRREHQVFVGEGPAAHDVEQHVRQVVGVGDAVGGGLDTVGRPQHCGEPRRSGGHIGGDVRKSSPAGSMRITSTTSGLETSVSTTIVHSQVPDAGTNRSTEQVGAPGRPVSSRRPCRSSGNGVVDDTGVELDDGVLESRGPHRGGRQGLGGLGPIGDQPAERLHRQRTPRPDLAAFVGIDEVRPDLLEVSHRPA